MEVPASQHYLGAMGACAVERIRLRHWGRHLVACLALLLVAAGLPQLPAPVFGAASDISVEARTDHPALAAPRAAHTFGTPPRGQLPDLQQAGDPFPGILPNPVAAEPGTAVLGGGFRQPHRLATHPHLWPDATGPPSALRFR